jgi:trehalose utilization protein
MSTCDHDWRELDESEKCWTCGSERPLSDASGITPLVDKQKREIVEHKEHISRLRDLLWSAEQELRELKSR